jgi:hypothetical protein
MAPGLACGDLLTIDEGVVDGRYDSAGLRGRVAMVVAVDPGERGTAITLAVPGVAEAPDEGDDATEIAAPPEEEE